MELNKIVFFSFSTNPIRRSVSYVISETKVKIDNIFKILSHMGWLYSRNNKKQKTLQLSLITENAHNKQTIKEKD